LKRKIKKPQESTEESSSITDVAANWNFAEKSETGFVGLSNQG
jgi:hypothetical protein